MTTWNTKNEIQHIKGIGSYTQQHKLPSRRQFLERKLELLKKYQKSMDLRVRWDNMDKAEIAAAVYDEIERVTDILDARNESQARPLKED